MDNGGASESLCGRLIPHCGVNIDNDEDSVRGRLVKCSGLQGTMPREFVVCIMSMWWCENSLNTVNKEELCWRGGGRRDCVEEADQRGR